MRVDLRMTVIFGTAAVEPGGGGAVSVCEDGDSGCGGCGSLGRVYCDRDSG